MSIAERIRSYSHRRREPGFYGVEEFVPVYERDKKLPVQGRLLVLFIDAIQRFMLGLMWLFVLHEWEEGKYTGASWTSWLRNCSSVR